jgi:hypothetical protein
MSLAEASMFMFMFMFMHNLTHPELSQLPQSNHRTRDGASSGRTFQFIHEAELSL